MTKTEQRVALAQDVIKQLTKKKLRAIKGEYVSGALRSAAKKLNEVSEYNTSSSKFSFGFFTYPNENLDMRDLINGELKSKTCSVCAKGALFLAHILRNDKVTLDEFVSVSLGSLLRETVEPCPIPAFTPRQLDEIEMLYESNSFYAGHKTYWDAASISKFDIIRKKLPAPADQRLKAIMRIIIKNKGQKVI